MEGESDRLRRRDQPPWPRPDGLGSRHRRPGEPGRERFIADRLSP